MIFYAGMGLGVGSIFVCTFTALSVSVPSQMTATAMTNYYLCQQLGLVVGVSVVSSASRAVFEKGLSQDIPLSKDKSQVCVQILLGPFYLTLLTWSQFTACWARFEWFSICFYLVWIHSVDCETLFLAVFWGHGRYGRTSRIAIFPANFGIAISCGGLVLVLLIFLKVPEKRLAK